MKYIFILGASDPEMATIENICKDKNYTVVYAAVDGQRVHTGNAYQADSIDLHKDSDLTPVWIECRSIDYQTNHVIIDHHREGDPGYGFQPDNYWLGSSIGQFCSLVSYNRSDELNVVAAADHCLSHAYKGQCPGVDPSVLRKWRAKTRANFQNISLAQLESNISYAISELRKKPITTINGEQFIDARRGNKLKELPEASAIIGESVMYEIYDHKSKRTKTGVLGGSAQKILAWSKWAETFLVNTYGDPERGYAGGYRA